MCIKELGDIYPFVKNVTLKATTNHVNILSLTQPRNHFPNLPYTKQILYL